ncbi:MAG TPA: FAD-dependent oxidoreductase [Cryomorphaceae bacterium]|nr:FAD-dependent oxidoreductase [Owenweeksia sp.]HAD97899.1 FAD-dependent oxidoreductase [Cryomorphaceae bacterium]|tara:strand:+ start:12021 stop:13361 length:1341 start_codon:yes stop_codon:yes gene_type:complete
MNSLNVPASNLPRILVVGCGFAGLNLVKKLSNKPFQVVMIDKHNYHTFQPLLYQVATAGLEPDSIAYPIRNIFRGQQNFFYRMALAEDINTEENILVTNIGNISYDYLVIATGSSTNFFGMKDLEEGSVPMKSVPEALNLRSIMLQNFEAASLTNDLQERERLMNFVIVGGGPTGVELAGSLAELKTHVLPNDYPDLDFRRMSIHLVEAESELLPPMSTNASKKAKAYLEELGVHVWLGTMVKAYDGDTVTTNKKALPASTLIWAAGVKGTIIKGLSDDAMEKGRYIVNEFNQVKGYENVFALGDVAAMISEENPKGHPMLAQVAIQQGVNLARNFVRWEQQKEPKAFSYNDLGTMATIGRNKAVADLNHMRFGGFMGWLLWMVVHLRGLVGYRNRMVVLMNWVINYFSYDKKIRLIIRPVKRRSNKDLKEITTDNKEAISAKNLE